MFAMRYSRRPLTWCRAFSLLCLLALLAAGFPGGTLAHAATPTLALTPESGPCTTQSPPLTARGVDFPPGLDVTLYIRPGASDNLATFPAGAVAEDGTFAVQFPLLGCGPNTPAGTPFLVGAYSGDSRRGEQLRLLAQVVFTVGALSDGQRCFAETGFCVGGRFLEYWQQNGSLARNGYPLTGEFRQTLEDGQEYAVQYFERVRLERHPGNDPPHDVLLGQFGRRIFAERTGRDADPVATPLPGQAYFVETGHNLGEGFLDYWAANGKLAQFGFPISEVFTERLEDGVEYRVQYFERARLEYHPENAGSPYAVLLGQFGRQILQETQAGR